MARSYFLLFLLNSFVLTPVSLAMDPVRGAQVIREQGCLGCHNVQGEGATKAPDLAARLVDHYTPAALAGLLWNHLPEMWTAINNEKGTRPRPSERDAEDLFAYLYSSYFLNPAGNQSRGEKAFTGRGCAACHSTGPALPVENWKGIRDPFGLVQQMWNHAGLMRNTRETRGVAFQKLSPRDLADLTAYASKGLARKPLPGTMPESLEGEALFKASCGGCHPTMVDLRSRLQDRTPTEIAVGLWNHAASMQTVPLAAPNDMRNLVGYVWNMQFQERGDAARGAKAFEEKRCASCHRQMNRGERVFTSYSLVSLWWVHGPLMQADKNRTRWPQLSPDDVSNLVAYMNRKP